MFRKFSLNLPYDAEKIKSIHIALKFYFATADIPNFINKKTTKSSPWSSFPAERLTAQSSNTAIISLPLRIILFTRQKLELDF